MNQHRTTSTPTRPDRLATGPRVNRNSRSRLARVGIRRAALLTSAVVLAVGASWSTLVAQTAPASDQPGPTSAPATVPALTGSRNWKPAPAPDAAFDRASAERFAWIADTLSNVQLKDDAIATAWASQIAALYDMARRAAPTEARFQRGYIDACLTLGRRDAAIEALAALRKIDPANELAQVQTLDLALDGLESTDAKIAYLEQVVAAKTVTAEVRSHAAVQAYTLYTERGDDESAQRMLKQSLEINPQNLVALNVNLSAALTTGTATDKASRLKDVLMASPFDPRAIITLAHLASANGANAEAAQLYSMGTVLTQSRGATPSFVDVLAQLGATALTGDSRLLAGTAEIYLRAAANDPTLHTARVVAQRLDGKSFDDVKPLADEVRGTWLGRLAGVSEPLNRKPGTAEKDVPAPTTAPSQPMPPVEADVAKLRELKNEELNNIYASTILDLVYYDALVRREASPEMLTRAIANLVGEQNPMYALAEGVRLMRVAGQGELAKQKLQAIEKDDDRAAIALAEIERVAGNADAAKSLAEEVLKRNPSGEAGLFAAMVAVDVGAKPQITDEGKAVGEIAKATYEHVARAWQRPRDFYLLTADPVKVGFEFGEPILVTLTLRTTSQTPVTVGPSGQLSPVVNFDAVVNVAGIGPVPAIATAKLAGPIRLNPGETYKQTVRLDQFRLYSVLAQFPTISMPMRAYMSPNSVATAQGAQLLPGGVQTQVGRIIERRAAPVQLPAFLDQAYRELREGPADVRLRRYELLTSIAPLYRSNASSPQAQDAAAVLDKATAEAFEAEPSARVRAWMAFARLSIVGRDSGATPAAVMTQVKALLADKDEQVRAVGAVLAMQFPIEARAELANAIAPDSPETSQAMKDFALALRTLPDKAFEEATAKPATQPTTQPTP
jgi:tetratricopeptide (TPR) repeat protein